MKWLIVIVVMGLSSIAQGRDQADGRIFASRSTKTAIVLTTSTTTSPFTCALATNAQACQRRRYKAFTPIQFTSDEQDMLLDASQMEAEDIETTDEGAIGGVRNPRIALTIWTTTSSTFTVTSTSTNLATTFSLSFFCTVVGASFPPNCG